MRLPTKRCQIFLEHDASVECFMCVYPLLETESKSISIDEWGGEEVPRLAAEQESKPEYPAEVHAVEWGRIENEARNLALSTRGYYHATLREVSHREK